MKAILRYGHLWMHLSHYSFLTYFTTRIDIVLFLIGKIFRFLFFVVFLFTIFGQTKLLAGYTGAQMLFFYLTFTFLDNASQFFFREVYRFRPMIVSGDFDLVLVKPFNPLFRVLVGGADPLDLFMLILYAAALIFSGSRLDQPTTLSFFEYFLLLSNGFLIATGFHILVLALAIVTTEVDHAIMIYRDLTMMGRVPIDIYHQPIRGILTFVLPVGIMMTFPAKALMGLLSPWTILFSFILGSMFFVLCLRVWRYALSRYSSASS